MIDSGDVLKALAAHGVVQWAKISVGRDVLDSLVRPPMITWRYVEPGSLLGEQIASLVRSFAGSVQWTVNMSGRNWFILPSRLEEMLRGAAPGYVGTLSDLKHEDQDFCARATEDLAELLRRLKEMPGV